MIESYPLITTIVASIVLAFIFGYTAKLFKLPSILGYLVAGICIGPYTPGFVANQAIAAQLAEIGVILLMFGVGLHFSLKDLLAARHIALPGAIIQMIVITLIGMVYLHAHGASHAEALVFGFSISVASTVVLLRALEQRQMLATSSGRLAVGWLIVEDIAMVLAIVMLPIFAASAVEGSIFDLNKTLLTLSVTLLKITAFAVLMVVFGRRFLPVLLVRVARQRSRELSSLCTLAIALGFAYLAYVAFDASFALGAFLAGMVLNESDIGRKSAEQSLPLRDTFAVLFFVAVGMLFDPSVLLRDPFGVLVVFLLIVLGKSLVTFAITASFKLSVPVSTFIAISRAQIGEFSFIFAGMALSLGIMQQATYDLVLAGALLSIVANSLMFRVMDRYTS